MCTEDIYDVIVVGAGHAGCEAALAAARMGHKVLLLTINVDNIAQMSCNPAIGGLAKGHLVKEIDALGGEMAKNADETAIQFRRLNTKKGPAVQGTRTQNDMYLYKQRMRKVLERQENIHIRQAMVDRLLVRDKKVYGVETNIGEKFFSKTVILTTGTFLRGVIHIGLTHFPAGRMGDPPSNKLSENLMELGFEIDRFKTGTTPRLDGKSIDYSSLEIQKGDENPKPFSFSTKEIKLPQLPCYITYTTPKTHDIIREGLDRSPLYTGIIKARGVRYCPSIEDKIVKFPDRPRHQIFLEPEGLDTVEVYPNGISTSLPIDIQIRMVRSIPGLEKARIIRPGYGIEHDYINPIQIKPNLETKLIEGLFFAGQINGTTGYEEAAAQGLMAGINAVLKIRGEQPLILSRAQAYIGVLIDDLVTKGTDEPYRMFTSRAEYRLLLREDNADFRLMDIGYRLGLVDEETYRAFCEKRRKVEELIKRLNEFRIRPEPSIQDRLKQLGTSPIKNATTLAQLLKRSEISLSQLHVFDEHLKEIEPQVAEEVEIRIKYEGYIKRQERQVEQLKKIEEIKIPEDIDYTKVHGLTKEAVEKLSKVRPLTLGQASRIPGITPASIVALQIYIKKREKDERSTDMSALR
ncbi:MAG: tRNA uridine-5-carboxymethylaminomethyl(34) synthesis enzyme MnmG [Deltaproteobacteria bacterium]|nr:MAG: tRNA uridine-5-carboxymethylaminomethyl(34) synthesis enzyme MnmG [Deltaproteobacteria bacterium]